MWRLMTLSELTRRLNRLEEQGKKGGRDYEFWFVEQDNRAILWINENNEVKPHATKKVHDHSYA